MTSPCFSFITGVIIIIITITIIIVIVIQVIVCPGLSGTVLAYVCYLAIISNSVLILVINYMLILITVPIYYRVVERIELSLCIVFSNGAGSQAHIHPFGKFDHLLWPRHFPRLEAMVLWCYGADTTLRVGGLAQWLSAQTLMLDYLSMDPGSALY